MITSRLLLASSRLGARLGLCLGAALAVSACVTSETPVLGPSEQPFGDGGRFQFYSLRNGAAHDPSLLQLRWNGSRYTALGPDFHRENALSFHTLDRNDLIVQVIDGRPDRKVDYAVMRQVTEGVYLVHPVDEDDADAETRAKFCGAQSGCRVTTPEQVMGLARATAAKTHSRGALAIRIGNDK